MLAGLIFATEDADDRPGVLAATLPFGGLTLVEFQARLLIAAGASQIILVVARMTPELLGAINRIGRRGAAVDAVRTATEVAEKLHPLARLLVVADGLVTNAEIVSQLAGEGDDALLVIDDREASPGLERVGATAVWAGLARLDPRHVAEVAALPRDYDFQSTLLRVAAQAGVAHLRLPEGEPAHGVFRDSRDLADRGKAILAALVAPPIRWADRYILAPLVRLALPRLVGRAVPTSALGGAGILIALAAGGAMRFGWVASGIGAAIVAVILFSIGAVLAWLRDEDSLVRFGRGGALATAALTALLLGDSVRLAGGTATGLAIAVAGIIAAGLVERAGGAAIRRRWWASPVAYPVVMLPLAIGGQVVAALAVAAGYAALTLGAAIEALREKP
ncbi:MAG: hypothetical protein JWL96_3991 [Sphingomonas bacterium]|uniref:hypothetical protein n=1 Tax=Sphingomonas bacterium TaxID=1895847 RepID=UPI00260DD679|nr:hypothetical protein [Sphingomonas bacterium]MDB5711921.1 hypothetical protein [Sphingomonas bacterium]